MFRAFRPQEVSFHYSRLLRDNIAKKRVPHSKLLSDKVKKPKIALPVPEPAQKESSPHGRLPGIRLGEQH